MTDHAPPSAADDPREVAAFSDVVREHRAVLVRLARQICPNQDYELAVDDGLLLLYRNWRAITGDRVAWVTVVVKNRAIDLRRRSREQADELTEHDVPIWSAQVSAELRLEFRTALERLPRLTRQEQVALVLTLFGHTTADIAARIGVSQASVRSYRSQAQRRMRHWLDRQHPRRPHRTDAGEEV
ncbi:sigma-70 family RNA polymerase sigma factor [Amycolatopsis sp. NPDC050768]|uniref:RNA polymerase sigma factor n=1 Tax=Amycolatopsis sp. NPDC050768 TaxID=3154839 RepID=UPI0033D29563